MLRFIDEVAKSTRLRECCTITWEISRHEPTKRPVVVKFCFSHFITLKLESISLDSKLDIKKQR